MARDVGHAEAAIAWYARAMCRCVRGRFRDAITAASADSSSVRMNSPDVDADETTGSANALRESSRTGRKVACAPVLRLDANAVTKALQVVGAFGVVQQQVLVGWQVAHHHAAIWYSSARLARRWRPARSGSEFCAGGAAQRHVRTAGFCAACHAGRGAQQEQASAEGRGCGVNSWIHDLTTDLARQFREY